MYYLKKNVGHSKLILEKEVSAVAMAKYIKIFVLFISIHSTRNKRVTSKYLV